jgi:hypothetical protein
MVSDSTNGRRRKIALVCEEFQQAWRSHQDPRIEHYLQRIQFADRSDLIRQLIELEIRFRREKGERIDLPEYRDRFPDEIQFIGQLESMLK